MFMHGQPVPSAALTQPWRLPSHGLAVFHGERHAPRLSHYFMPRLALEGKRILFLDGANCVDPRLMARLAERRGMPFAQFNQQIMLARAFTCFQLTELISRVPQFLAQFPAQVLMVTAFPELYFDEDVRQADAHAAFQQALGHLAGCWGLGAGGWGKNETRNSKLETRERDDEFPVPSFQFRPPIENRNSKIETRKSSTEFQVSSFEFRPSIENRQSEIDHGQSLAPSPQHPTVTVALFTGASGFQPPAGRKLFFAQTCAAATELWKFQVDGQGRLGLTQQDKVLGAGDWGLGKNPSPQHLVPSTQGVYPWDERLPRFAT